MALSETEIEKILREVAGDPSAGAVADIIPAMAKAVAKASKPAKATDGADT